MSFTLQYSILYYMSLADDSGSPGYEVDYNLQFPDIAELNRVRRKPPEIPRR